MGTDDDNNQQQDNSLGGHPAHQELYDILPSDLHSLVKPVLDKWDNGVQKELKEYKDSYSGYQPFIENDIPPEVIEQALGLVQALNTDPETTIKDAIKAFELTGDQLGFAQAVAAAEQQQSLEDNGYENEMTDPQLKALQETVNSLQETINKKDQEEQAKQQEEEQNAQAEKVLKELHEAHGEFDDMMVLTYLANGLDGESAVKRYNEAVNQAAQKLAEQNNTEISTPPPTVMGGSGSGSGLPQEPIQYGKLKDGDVNSIVANLLRSGNNEGN